MIAEDALDGGAVRPAATFGGRPQPFAGGSAVCAEPRTGAGFWH